jgi:Uma2 family endonuclease
MSTVLEPAARPPAPTGPRRAAGERILLSGIRWATYQVLLTDLKDHPIRLTYDRGSLEIMAPTFNHERCKRQLGRLVETLAEEGGKALVAGGSTTFHRQDLERGLEPDDCFYLAHAAAVLGKAEIDLRHDPPPDLALEIDITRSSLDRLAIYAALGVPEVWRFDGRRLEVYLRRGDGTFGLSTQSLSFPTLPLPEFEAFLLENAGLDDSALVRLFRGWIGTHMSAPGPQSP